jgi:hypothetical protein
VSTPGSKFRVQSAPRNEEKLVPKGLSTYQ